MNMWYKCTRQYHPDIKAMRLPFEVMHMEKRDTLQIVKFVYTILKSRSYKKESCDE